MRETFQFKDIDMLKHGEMVCEEYKKIIRAIEDKNESYLKEIGLLFEFSFIEKIKSYQYDQDIMMSYQMYHDCGKHISKVTDNDGKTHYPNHAAHSAELYGEYFDKKIAQQLILKDLNFHTLKSEDLIKWIKEEDEYTLASLYLTAWSEILANASMFGGINSDSFKIKRKRLIQSGKKLRERMQ